MKLTDQMAPDVVDFDTLSTGEYFQYCDLLYMKCSFVKLPWNAIVIAGGDRDTEFTGWFTPATKVRRVKIHEVIFS